MTSPEPEISMQARQGRIRSLLGNLGWLLASNGLMAVLSLVYLGVATRTLGIADFGRFALITGASQTIATLVSFETWKIVVQYGLEHQAAGNRDAVYRVMKTSALVDLSSALVGMLCVVLLFTIWQEPFGIGGDMKVYVLGYAIIQLITLRSTAIGIMRFRDEFRLAALADSATPIGRFVGAWLAFAFWPTLQGFLVAWAVAEVLTAVAHWALVAKMGDLRGLAGAKVRWRTVMAENERLFRFLWSTNVHSSLGLAARQVPLLLVGGYAGVAAAGAFRIALQLANALSKISLLVSWAAFPEIVRSVRQVPRERFGWLLGRIVLSSIAGAALVMVLAILFGEALLTAIGGSAFDAAYILLLWLVAAGCMDIASVSFEPILLAVHRAGTTMIARGAAVLLQFAGLFALLPTMGALGASVSLFGGSALTALFLGAALLFYAVREHGDQTAAIEPDDHMAPMMFLNEPDAER